MKKNVVPCSPLWTKWELQQQQQTKIFSCVHRCWKEKPRKNILAKKKANLFSHVTKKLRRNDHGKINKYISPAIGQKKLIILIYFSVTPDFLNWGSIQAYSMNLNPLISCLVSFQERQWFWSDGSRFKYRKWCRGEPNNSILRQHCLHINHGGNTTLCLL